MGRQSLALCTLSKQWLGSRCIYRTSCLRSTSRCSASAAPSTQPRLSRVAEALPRSQIRVIMELAWAAEREGRKVYHMEVGQPDLPAPLVAVEAAKLALDDPVALRYCPNAGELSTRRCIASAIARKSGYRTEAEDVIVSIGATGILSALFSAILEAGDEVLLPDPLWPNCDMASRLFGASPVHYRLTAERGFLPDIAEIESAITGRTKALYICSPSNPTGRVMSQELMDAVIGLCLKHGLFLISDEIYGDIVFEESLRGVSCLKSKLMSQASEHVVYVSGVSKAFAMTGFRVGFARAPRRLVAIMEKNQEALISCGVPFAQRGAAAVLASEAVTLGTIAAAVEQYGRRRDVAIGELAAVGLPMPAALVPQGAFYMLVPCAPRGEEDCSQEVALNLLASANVACAPGGTFGREAENFVRLSFATSEPDVKEGTARLARYLLEKRGASAWWPA